MQAKAEEGQKFEAESVASCEEGRDFGLVGGKGWRKRLLSTTVGVFTDVKCPFVKVSWSA